MTFNDQNMDAVIEGERAEGAKEEAFAEDQVTIDKIMERGIQEYLAEEVPNLSDAFDLEKHQPPVSPEVHDCICCMDERTPYGRHIPGSGLGMTEEQLREIVKEYGIDSLSSHDGCGYAKIYAEQNGLIGNPDLIAREQTEDMARKLGLTHVHLSLEEEKPFHYARTCYYDSTGKFNYRGVEGLPAGFVVSDLDGISKESSLSSVKLAMSIAFGDHGLAGLLSEENPFMLVAVANAEEQLEALKTQLAKLAESFGTKVVVDGFLAPKE